MAFKPFACICYLEVGRSGDDEPVIRGSGWVAGAVKGLVCTSGHTLHPGDFEPGWVRVWVGGQHRREGTACRGTRWAVHPRWKSDRDDACDLALVYDVGDLRKHGAFAASDLAKPDMKIKVTGFPADGPSDRRCPFGVIDGTTPGLVRYQLNDATHSGMSGSPVWTTDKTARPTVVAVHTDYKDGRGFGVRLTAEHIEWIKSHR